MKDKVGVVCGATGGIGQEVAQTLASRGASLVLLGRSEPKLKARKAALEGLRPGSVLGCASVDFASEASLEKVRCSLRKLERVDILVHSAGFVSLGSLEDAPLEDLDRNYQVNVRGPLALTQAVLPQLRLARGHVVFINSGAGLHARATWGHYAASKHALVAIASSLREETRASGMRVTSVFPGRTATPMQRRVADLEGKAYREEAFVRPQDVAHMVGELLALPPSAEVVDLQVRPGP